MPTIKGESSTDASATITTDSETEPPFPSEGAGEASQHVLENSVTESTTITSGPDEMHPQLANSDISYCNNSVGEIIGWTLAGVSTVLFVSLTINIIMLWVYKKGQSKDNNNVESPVYEMEGNPCYEASNLRRIAVTAGE